MSVHVLLITGPDEALEAFHANNSFTLLAQQRRGQTVSYTCMGDDLQGAITSARACDVTLQEINGAGRDEQYEARVIGSHGMKWAKG